MWGPPVVCCLQVLPDGVRNECIQVLPVVVLNDSIQVLPGVVINDCILWCLAKTPKLLVKPKILGKVGHHGNLFLYM